MNPLIRFLAWVGFVHVNSSGKVYWPFAWPSWSHFWFYLRHADGKMFKRFYVFRNLPHVIKWREGRLLPRRWGFGFCGIEFGDRGH